MHTILTIPENFKPNSTTLANQAVLITGAGSEIGSALALAAAQAGATVLMLDLKQRLMTPQYDLICDQGLAEPMMIEFDISKTDPQGFENLGTSLRANIPEIHGLVHCAMWGAPLTPLAHTDFATWEKVLEQHLIKPMYLTKSLYPSLNHSNPSSIIFTTMDVGRTSRAYWGPIGAAYAGIENLCETLSAECSDYHTRVNTIDPGKVKTAIRKQFYPDENVHGLREPNDTEITDAYVYLLSNQSQDQTANRYSIAPLGN